MVAPEGASVDYGRGSARAEDDVIVGHNMGTCELVRLLVGKLI
jgi:hypothetical protein